METTQAIWNMVSEWGSLKRVKIPEEKLTGCSLKSQFVLYQYIYIALLTVQQKHIRIR